MVLCCFPIKVIKSCALKQTKDSGLLVAHWGASPAYSKLILTLCIYDTEAGRWLDRSSGPTSGGVDVHIYLPDSTDDNPMTAPVRYDLTYAGDAMNPRCDRYKSQTPPPPAGFDVYKYILWFNGEQLNY